VAGVILNNQDAEAHDVFFKLKRHMDRASDCVMSDAYGSCQTQLVASVWGVNGRRLKPTAGDTGASTFPDFVRALGEIRLEWSFF
jgi:hypothetical protein